MDFVFSKYPCLLSFLASRGQSISKDFLYYFIQGAGNMDQIYQASTFIRKRIHKAKNYRGIYQIIVILRFENEDYARTIEIHAPWGFGLQRRCPQRH
jgi:hypothetical protein